MDKDHLIKVLTTALENKRKVKPEIERLQKAYREVTEEKAKAIARVSASFETDLAEIKESLGRIVEDYAIGSSVGFYPEDKDQFLSNDLHVALIPFDYKLTNIKKNILDLSIQDEAIIELFAKEFGDIVQYWSPSNCY